VDDEAALRILLADNRTARLGSDNEAALAELLTELAGTERGLAGTGFDGDDLDTLLNDLAGQAGTELLTDPDEIPDNAPTRCNAGDLWQLGRHRIIVGDCRDADTVSRLLDGAKINVAVTSPPYASQRKYDEDSGFKPIPPDEYVEWYKAVADNIAAHLAPDGSYFCNIKEHCDDGQRHLYVKDLTIAHVRQWAWRFVDEFCWDRVHPGFPGWFPNRFKNGWESVFHFCKQSDIKFRPNNVLVEGTGEKCKAGKMNINGSGFADFEWDGTQGARPNNIVRVVIGETEGAVSHTATYPVALPEFFIKAFSDKDDTIYDPFMGSGTTLIAADQQGRIAYGCEISPLYADVILARYESATGKTAELIEHGTTNQV